MSNTSTANGAGDPFQLLEDLIAAPSPSGYEQPAQEVFRSYCRAFAGDDPDAVQTDVMGNVTVRLNPAGETSVMLAGHVDEIGFQISDIHKDGYLYFNTVGGHDATIVVGQRVTVHTAENGPLHGTIGRKAIHLLTAEDRKRVPEMKELVIDIGATKGSPILGMVAVGDPVTYAAGMERLIGDLAMSHAFDNKTGAFVVAETVRLLAAAGKPLATEVLGVSTVQEEIGLRGARTAGFATGAEVGIAIDVCHATDYPGAGKRDSAEPIRCGGGPVICRGANINPEVFRRLVAAAQAEGMKVQYDAVPGGTGTDANAMQIASAGMATGLVSIPLRYMHTPGEVVALQDVADTARLLARFIQDIEAGADFTPTMTNWRVAPPRKPDLADMDNSQGDGDEEEENRSDDVAGH